MPAASEVPENLLKRPFTRAELVGAGVSPRVLERGRFRRVYPRVWVHRDHQLSRPDQLRAARLALPARAQLSHESRIELLGYPLSFTGPFHFTVAGDLHLALPGIFLHRTEVLPPCDEDGVSPAAGFVQMCERHSLIRLVQVGDWLLRQDHATRTEIGEVAMLHRWRPGAAAARRVVPLLNDNSWALTESEVRLRLVATGLPRPEMNVPLYDGSQFLGTADLWFRRWRLALEVEGRQHFEDPKQVEYDVHRYAGYRRADVNYLQITAGMRRQTRSMVLSVYRELTRLGYRGPRPDFGSRWRALTLPPRVSGGPPHS